MALARTLQRGGEHVTRDIAAVLQTTTEEAERIKILHGCVDLSAVKPDHMIQVEGIDGPQTISRIELSEIIIAVMKRSLARSAMNSNKAVQFMVYTMV